MRLFFVVIEGVALWIDLLRLDHPAEVSRRVANIPLAFQVDDRRRATRRTVGFDQPPRDCQRQAVPTRIAQFQGDAFVERLEWLGVGGRLASARWGRRGGRGCGWGLRCVALRAVQCACAFGAGLPLLFALFWRCVALWGVGGRVPRCVGIRVTLVRGRLWLVVVVLALVLVLVLGVTSVVSSWCWIMIINSIRDYVSFPLPDCGGPMWLCQGDHVGADLDVTVVALATRI